MVGKTERCDGSRSTAALPAPPPPLAAAGCERQLSASSTSLEPESLSSPAVGADAELVPSCAALASLPLLPLALALLPLASFAANHC